MSVDKLIAALDEFDAAREDYSKAKQRVSRSEDALKRACGLDMKRYYSGDELVAAMARRLRLAIGSGEKRP